MKTSGNIPKFGKSTKHETAGSKANRRVVACDQNARSLSIESSVRIVSKRMSYYSSRKFTENEIAI